MGLAASVTNTYLKKTAAREGGLVRAGSIRKSAKLINAVSKLHT